MKNVANQITDEYLAFQIALQDSLGIVIGDDYRSRIEGRLQPIMLRERLSKLTELADALRQDQPASLRSDVLEAISVHDTAWFHFNDIHRLMCAYILPSLIDKRADSCRVWYPACGNGQGVLSLAMIMREALDELGSEIEVNITATDSSEESIAFASRCLFPESELEGMPERYQQRYMQMQGEDSKVDENICNMLEFRSIDLQTEVANGGRYDVIVSPDVLMYFSTGNKRSILDAYADLLAPSGVLLLNGGEMVVPFSERFEMVEHDIATFYRKLN